MMTNQQLPILRRKLRETQPLIHCITNHISIEQCANAILALGARPIMAEHPGEVVEITASSAALCVNLGNISDSRMTAAMFSGQAAADCGIPCVIDLVGIACSSLRLEFAQQFIEEAQPALLKGNASEIMSLCGLPCHTKGVDADEGTDPDSLHDQLVAAQAAAQRYHTVVLMSGEEDIITDGTVTLSVSNGSPRMTSVTGTGCMQGALAAAFLAVAPPMESAVAAAAFMGLAGEYAEEIFQKTNSITQFGLGIIDGIYAISDEALEANAKINWR